MWDLAERRFLDASDGWEKISIWGMGIASRDITGDQREEVMLTSMGDQLLQIAQPDGTYPTRRFPSEPMRIAPILAMTAALQRAGMRNLAI